jgi:pimeloyl-ACP methyl ester carboxylesterase
MTMPLIHHVRRGAGRPPIVLVHGFACALGDWDAQVAELSRRHETVAVDLAGHGRSPAPPEACSIERYGADVAEVMRALELAPAVLVGHSMGCRVVLEAALQAPEHVCGLVLVDGSQFAPAMQPVLTEAFARGEFRPTVHRLFVDMFTEKSDKAVAEAVVARAGRLPEAVGRKALLDLVRYDLVRLADTLGAVQVPLLAVQTTYSNEKRERKTMRKGDTTPYLDLVRAKVKGAAIEIIPDTGHFPQLDEPDRTTALIAQLARRIG